MSVRWIIEIPSTSLHWIADRHSISVHWMTKKYLIVTVITLIFTVTVISESYMVRIHRQQFFCTVNSILLYYPPCIVSPQYTANLFRFHFQQWVNNNMGLTLNFFGQKYGKSLFYARVHSLILKVATFCWHSISCVGVC